MLTFLLTTTTTSRCHDDDLEEEGVSERERARRPAGVATSVRALPRSQDCAPTRRRRTKRSAPPEQPPTPGRRHTVEVAVGREWSCWDDVGRRQMSRQATGQSQGPGATGVRVGSPSSLEAVSDVRASTQSKLRSRWRTGGRSRGHRRRERAIADCIRLWWKNQTERLVLCGLSLTHRSIGQPLLQYDLSAGAE